MKEEVWKDIPDYEGLYQASNLGRIRSLERDKPNGSKSVMRVPTRILKPILAQNSTNPRRKDVRVSLYKNSKMKYCLVGRLVASAFYGKSDLTINHINGNTLDNRMMECLLKSSSSIREQILLVSSKVVRVQVDIMELNLNYGLLKRKKTQGLNGNYYEMLLFSK